MKKLMIAGALAIAVATPAAAGWKLVPAGQPVAVAKSKMTVVPPQRWNRGTSRPSNKGEFWTLDGASLNQLSFFAGIADGETIYKDRQKKTKPLPQFKAGMLPTDIVQLFEASNRILLETSLFQVDKVEPARLGGHPGVRFEYHYSAANEQLNRRGEAVAAVVGGKLYLVDFAAPEIHYFERDISEARAVMGSVKL